MEGGMNAGVGRQLQGICDFPHTNSNLKRAIKPWCQFGVIVVTDRGLAIGLESEEDPISDFKLTLGVVFIGLVSHSILSKL